MKAYSRRMMLPYVGVVQIADLGWARALSLDGRNWAIRYVAHEDSQTRRFPLSHDPRVNLAFMLSIEGGHFKTRVVRPGQNSEKIQSDSQQLFDALGRMSVPFKAADRYEYWLLDSVDQKPLALLHTCVDEHETYHPVPHAQWRPLPAAELGVPDPETDEQGMYQPPVNYRLQKLIEKQAGPKPQAVWFKRAETEHDSFPPCLLRDEWDDPQSQRLTELYLQRLAPRLLMVDGLPHEVRQRLEKAACDYVFEVEQFYPLYPEVIDNSLLNAARVEARMRRANDRQHHDG